MSTTTEHHSLALHPRSRDQGSPGATSPARRDPRSRSVTSLPSGLPPVMGPPDHAPDVPAMGFPSAGPHHGVMGGPDTGPRLDPMGGPDTGPSMHLMGESDLTFVDFVFAQRRSLR